MKRFKKKALKENNFTTIKGYEWFIVPDERLTEFRDIIVNLTKQTLKPDEKIRKQPVRSVNKTKLLGLTNQNPNTKRLEQTKKKKK